MGYQDRPREELFQYLEWRLGVSRDEIRLTRFRQSIAYYDQFFATVRIGRRKLKCYRSPVTQSWSIRKSRPALP